MIRSMFVPTTPAPLQQQILSMMLKAPEATATAAMAAMFDPAIRTADVTKAPALAVYATRALPYEATNRTWCPASAGSMRPRASVRSAQLDLAARLKAPAV